MNRELGAFETALALTDEYSPFNVVATVRLAGGPAPDTLQRVLEVLQRRHPMLAVRVTVTSGGRRFESAGTPAIALEVIRRVDDEHWIRVVEEELNRRVDTGTGPLFRCRYLFDEANWVRSEIILTFPHVAVDGASGTNLVHELLSLCAATDDNDVSAVYGPLPLVPAAEDAFPATFRGWGRRFRTIMFLLRQMADEVGYRLRSRGTGKASPVASARCCALTMCLSRDGTAALIKQTRIRRVTLVSALNAAMLIAVSHHLYDGRDLPLRYFVFPDLRPYLEPPMPEEHLAAVIAMMRFTTRVRSDQELWSLAHQINGQTYASYKRGDKFLFPLMSRHIMRALIKTKWYRMGTTALVYTGVPKIDSAYGPLHVRALHAFVSNIDLGPEYSAQARIFGGELHWDVVYMDSDMDSNLANEIAQTMRRILLAASDGESSPSKEPAEEQ